MMRVAVDNITVSGKARTMEVFKNAGTGDRFRAKILDRHDNNRALLDVRGTRIYAEFIKGVPAGNFITLVLTKVTGNSLVFKLDDPSTASWEDLLNRFTLIGKTTLESLPSGTKPLVQTVFPSGIFELNHVLLAYLGYEVSNRSSLAAILNRLRSLGIKTENLEVFSYLFWHIKGINLDYLLAIMNALGQKERNWFSKRKEAPGRSDNNVLMEGLTEEIDELIRNNREEGKEALKDLLLAVEGMRIEIHKGVISGQLPWFDGEDFSDVEFLTDRKTLIIRAVFTVLGAITVLAMDRSGTLDISIVCEKDETLYKLKQDSSRLRTTLTVESDKIVNLNIYLEGLVLEKFKESYRGLLMQGGFNHWA